MITCEVFRRHVDAVVDGEVDPDTQIEFERHLDACGPCRVHLSFSRAMKVRVKEAAGDWPGAPPDLASRIRHALDAEDVRRAASAPDAPVGAARTERPPLGIQGVRFLPVKAKYAVPAAAAAVALAFLAAREGGNPVGVEGLAVEAASATTGGVDIFEDVVRRHSSEHPAEVSGPPTQVASWFRGKLQFPVRPIEFGGRDVRLVGARISNVRDREAAAFFYTVRGRRVTVMVFEPPAPVDRMARRANVHGRGVYYGSAHGYTVPVVEHEGLTYAIAGDLDRRSLLRLAASARVRP
ncbi:MAG TPA: zf-HC2 domain-containing protein [Sandaracinaceae bacterium LLY-WYZ-13_1]|nr:zf-HC2 domain-containing protein [Sandaracinaceae bacterium LLY-WYZ-13_1]